MAFQPIADAEIAPGAPITSSLVTRLRDNTVLNYELHTERAAGDIIIAGGSGEATAGTLTGGTITGTWTAAFSGEYRFDLTITSAPVTIYRNDVSVSGPHASTTSVDIDGWAQGDEIKVVGNVPSSTGTLIYTIGVDVPAPALWGQTVSANGQDIP